MQTLGVKYLMVFTEAAKAQADTQVDLTLVATSGPWNVYEVAGSAIVEGLSVEPVVVNGRDGDQRERNLELGTSWFQHREEWAAMPADDGPESWQRIDVSVDLSRRIGAKPRDPGRRVDVVQPAEPIEVRQLPEVRVSNIDLGEQDLQFTVDKIGVPVLVKISYFPNWKVDGAQGPYRIAPNLMVVIPTSTKVSMHYDRSSLDFGAYLLTLIGIGALVLFRRRGDVVHRSADPFGVRLDPTPAAACVAAAGVAAAGVAGHGAGDVDEEWVERWPEDGDLAVEPEIPEPAWLDIDEESPDDHKEQPFPPDSVSP
jgi:hypothetical protein